MSEAWLHELDEMIAVGIAAERGRWQAEIERLRTENQIAWNIADELDERARHAKAAERERCAKLEEMLSQAIALMRAWGYDTYAAAYERNMQGTSLDCCTAVREGE